MKTTLAFVTAALSALALAHPRAIPSSEHELIAPRVTQNGSDIATTDEPIPDFELPCECPAAICNPNMNAKSVSPLNTLKDGCSSTTRQGGGQGSPFLFKTEQSACTDVRLFQICECEASAAQACYIKSAGGCAMPKIAVSAPVAFPSSVFGFSLNY